MDLCDIFLYNTTTWVTPQSAPMVPVLKSFTVEIYRSVPDSLKNDKQK